MTAEPLARLISSTQFSDQEISRLFANASKDAQKIMARLEGREGVGAAVRRAQIQLAALQAETWAATHGAIKIGIKDAVWNAAEYQSLIDEGLFAAAGLSSAYWKQAVLLQAQQGIPNLLSRKENGISLSDRVYKNSKTGKAQVEDAINNGLLLGKSAKEIAKSVVGFIDPKTPGGASYAAMRLGRSEVANAMHTTNVNGYKANPWVERCKWHLSGSHSRPDECNEYATAQNGDGWDAGVWDLGEVPAKPHPNCMCYTTPVTDSLEDFVKKHKAGAYDSYLNEMGCF